MDNLSLKEQILAISEGIDTQIRDRIIFVSGIALLAGLNQQDALKAAITHVKTQMDFDITNIFQVNNPQNNSTITKTRRINNNQPKRDDNGKFIPKSEILNTQTPAPEIPEGVIITPNNMIDSKNYKHIKQIAELHNTTKEDICSILVTCGYANYQPKRHDRIIPADRALMQTGIYQAVLKDPNNKNILYYTWNTQWIENIINNFKTAN